MESLAMTHLERQGFECYGPKVLQEGILRKKRVAQEALSLYPVRSTVGVTNLVTFRPISP
jgi:hypothetical protein